jgi:hypothetical protein
MDSQRRQPVTNDDREISVVFTLRVKNFLTRSVRTTLLQCKPRPVVESPSQVGTLKKCHSIAGGTLNYDYVHTQGPNVARDFFRIKWEVNSIARCRVGQLELQPRARRQAAAGTSQRDASRRGATEAVPRIGRKRVIRHR